MILLLLVDHLVSCLAGSLRLRWLESQATPLPTLSQLAQRLE